MHNSSCDLGCWLATNCKLVRCKSRQVGFETRSHCTAEVQVLGMEDIFLRSAVKSTVDAAVSFHSLEDHRPF